MPVITPISLTPVAPTVSHSAMYAIPDTSLASLAAVVAQAQTDGVPLTARANFSTIAPLGTAEVFFNW